MNIYDILILAAIAIICAFVTFYFIGNKKSGACIGCRGCSGCNGKCK